MTRKHKKPTNKSQGGRIIKKPSSIITGFHQKVNAFKPAAAIPYCFTKPDPICIAKKV